jgi:type VI secretion system secreted protein VgrG
MYLRKVKRTMAAASNSLEQDQTKLPAPLPDLSCGPNVACFRISDALTGAEDMDLLIRLTHPQVRCREELIQP